MEVPKTATKAVMMNDLENIVLSMYLVRYHREGY